MGIDTFEVGSFIGGSIIISQTKFFFVIDSIILSFMSLSVVMPY